MVSLVRVLPAASAGGSLGFVLRFDYILYCCFDRFFAIQNFTIASCRPCLWYMERDLLLSKATCAIGFQLVTNGLGQHVRSRNNYVNVIRPGMNCVQVPIAKIVMFVACLLHCDSIFRF